MDLNTAKKRLTDALKDKCQRYWDLMKSWYRRRIPKDEFDSKARSLLGEGNVHLHNEFLFAILVKCQTGVQLDSQPSLTAHPIPEKPHTKRRKVGPLADPLPYGCLDPLQYHPPPKVQLAGGRDLDSLLLCSHELLLPDIATLHARMLLGAWEEGLEGVTEESANLLMHALEYQLKSVLQTLIAHRTSWRLRTAAFQHSFGSGLASQAPPMLPAPGRLHPPPGISQGEMAVAETALRAAQSAPVRQLEPLTLFHLRDALQVNRQCIPVHWVYACTMERLLSIMWHPSKEEEEQERTVEQWRRSLVRPTHTTMTTPAHTGTHITGR